MVQPNRFPTLKNDCVLCGRCLEACPVFAATNKEELSPRAKGFLTRVLAERPGSVSLKRVQELASLCVGCGRCSAVCPQGLDVPALLAAVKAKSPGWREWAWKMGLATAPAWSLLLQVSGGRNLFQPLRPLMHLDRGMDPPLFSQAMLFPGCMASHVMGCWTDTACGLLEAMGVTATILKWKCCGFSMGRSGLLGEQMDAARENIALWRDAGRQPIILFCATCLKGLGEYVELDLTWEQGEREQWHASLYSLGSLMKGAQVSSVNLAPSQGVIYHRSCHEIEPLHWLEHAGSWGPIRSTAHCCGFGGQLQLLSPGLSRMVTGRFWDCLPLPAPAHVITGCSGCVLQLKRHAPEGFSVGHWLESLSI
ncbi:MAG: (Fe-S)-binding protein [Desulfovibrionales bacterium]